MYRKLTIEECRSAMAQGDFSPELRGSDPKVAIVLTQSWCPQWIWMTRYLEAVSKAEGCAIYWIEYDREAIFDDFMRFKEETFGNRSIPYVRYYRNGVLARESNYIDRAGFLRFLEG